MRLVLETVVSQEKLQMRLEKKKKEKDSNKGM